MSGSNPLEIIVVKGITTAKESLYYDSKKSKLKLRDNYQNLLTVKQI